MGKEVETAEEPEAAYLRNALRRINGIVERTAEAGPWSLSTTAGLAEIATVVSAALQRKATNGPVIDELYRKIAKLEAAAIDHSLDLGALSDSRTEIATLRELLKRQGAEVGSLRTQLAAAQATQANALDLSDEARTFLGKLAENLAFMGEHGVSMKHEKAQEWSARLFALSGKKP